MGGPLFRLPPPLPAKSFSFEEHRYANHADGMRDRQAERTSPFCVVGSKDETAGDQSCQPVVARDGSPLAPVAAAGRVGESDPKPSS
ncbi:hypothetical protein MPNT_280011 [Candidatus Methylacidithermus pantelleriae]|uniref:Uncharacterized protein n=1 Tax=Candidatus Methylacidithermus pantelleriae TaxID=2744239 RepID=A0A8J2FWC5_9BACT|nr:hypothetical protein MPNT_280011 [Candidatus Methylacidithermus pantelleriae]